MMGYENDVGNYCPNAVHEGDKGDAVRLAHLGAKAACWICNEFAFVAWVFNPATAKKLHHRDTSSQLINIAKRLQMVRMRPALHSRRRSEARAFLSLAPSLSREWEPWTK